MTELKSIAAFNKGELETRCTVYFSTRVLLNCGAHRPSIRVANCFLTSLVTMSPTLSCGVTYLICFTLQIDAEIWTPDLKSDWFHRKNEWTSHQQKKRFRAELILQTKQHFFGSCIICFIFFFFDPMEGAKQTRRMDWTALQFLGQENKKIGWAGVGRGYAGPLMRISTEHLNLQETENGHWRYHSFLIYCEAVSIHVSFSTRLLTWLKPQHKDMFDSTELGSAKNTGCLIFVTGTTQIYSVIWRNLNEEV